MNDQDEIFEAATETPATLGCPSLVPPQVIAHKALKTYIKQLSGASKFHSRGGFLKQAVKRLHEAQENGGEK